MEYIGVIGVATGDLLYNVAPRLIAVIIIDTIQNAEECAFSHPALSSNLDQTRHYGRVSAWTEKT